MPQHPTPWLARSTHRTESTHSVGTRAPNSEHPYSAPREERLPAARRTVAPTTTEKVTPCRGEVPAITAPAAQYLAQHPTVMALLAALHDCLAQPLARPEESTDRETDPPSR